MAAKRKPAQRTLLAELRNAFADYLASEGCGCCRDDGPHNAAAKRLGKLLRVPKFKDGSGYDFYRYRSKS